MEDEFKKIMEFFSLSPEDKAVKLEDIFQDSIEFFSKFQHVLENGTEEEKSEILSKVMQLQQMLQEETKKMCSDSGLTEEQLREFANNRDNFSEEEWATIVSAKSKLDEQANAIAKKLPGGKENPSLEKAKKPASKKKEKKWMKS